MKGSHRHRTVVSIAVALMLALAAPAAASATYGAIAVNPGSTGFGVYYGAPSKSSAERHALLKCPGSCKIIVWVRNQCAAVVVSGKRFFAGLGSSKSAAISNARGRAPNGAGRLRAWVCTA